MICEILQPVSEIDGASEHPKDFVDRAQVATIAHDLGFFIFEVLQVLQLFCLGTQLALPI